MSLRTTARLMQIVVRNPGVKARTLLGGLEETMPRRPPGETFSLAGPLDTNQNQIPSYSTLYFK